MNLRQLILWGGFALEHAGVENYNNEARILASYVFNIDASKLNFHYEMPVEYKPAKEYESLIEQRKNKKPLQYILKSWDFYSLKFRLSKDTLIPRSETEILVDVVLKKNNGKSGLNILDLCTGSGCIAISLLKNIKDSKAVLVDISRGAANMAKINSENNGVFQNVEIICADIGQIKFKNSEFDIIVSNPPYIKTKDLQRLDKTILCYEPIIALDGGESGLDFYEIIIKRHTNSLKSGGIIAFEIGDFADSKEKMSAPIGQMLQKNGYKDIEIFKDYNKLQRVITAKKI